MKASAVGMDSPRIPVQYATSASCFCSPNPGKMLQTVSTHWPRGIRPAWPPDWVEWLHDASRHRASTHNRKHNERKDWYRSARRGRHCGLSKALTGSTELTGQSLLVELWPTVSPRKQSSPQLGWTHWLPWKGLQVQICWPS